MMMMTMNADNLCDCCEERVGTIACLRCSALLCEECDRTVHATPKFSNHERAHEENVLGICSAHGMRAFVLCEDCKEVCCRRCMVEQHSGHLFVKSTAASERYTKGTNLVSALGCAKDVASKTAARVQDSITALNEERQKALDAIEASFNQITELIEARKMALLEQVASTADEEENRLQTLYNDLDTKCTLAEQLLDEFNAQLQNEDRPDHSMPASSSSTSSSVVAVSAEMEKCFDDLCSNAKKAMADSKDNVTKIEFVEFVSPQPLLNSGAGAPARPRPSQLLSPFLRGMAMAQASASTSSDSETKSTNVSIIENVINGFGVIKTERQNQSKIESKALLLTMSKGEPNPDGSRSATLSWDNAPDHIKDLLDNEDFFFVLKSRSEKDSEFKEIYNGKDLSRAVACNKNEEFIVSGCINGVSDRVELWTSNIAIVANDPGVWKIGRNYSLENGGKRVVFSGSARAIALGETVLERGDVYEWSFKVEKAISIGGGELCLGVAPQDTSSGDTDPDTCGGWFFGCFFANLRGKNRSGGKKYGSGKPDGGYVKEGDEVGIVVDMIKGEISFVLGGENLGVAFKGIPLDKPLVPAVLSCSNDNSVELISK